MCTGKYNDGKFDVMSVGMKGSLQFAPLLTGFDSVAKHDCDTKTYGV